MHDRHGRSWHSHSGLHTLFIPIEIGAAASGTQQARSRERFIYSNTRYNQSTVTNWKTFTNEQKQNLGLKQADAWKQFCTWSERDVRCGQMQDWQYLNVREEEMTWDSSLHTYHERTLNILVLKLRFSIRYTVSVCFVIRCQMPCFFFFFKLYSTFCYCFHFQYQLWEMLLWQGKDIARLVWCHEGIKLICHYIWAVMINSFSVLCDWCFADD